MKRVALILLCVVVFALPLFAGGKQANSGAVRVAYLTPSMDIPFWRYMAFGISDELKKLVPGSEVTVYDSKDSPNTQFSNAQDAITRRVKAIVISPTNSATCVAVLDLAKEAKIPVVICDIGTDAGTYESFVSTDNEGGARELGAYIATKLPANSTIAQITIPLARINGQLRKKGFADGVQVNGIKDIDFKQTERVNREEGVRFAQDLFTAHPQLSAIFCQADEPSLGALAAIEQAGKSNSLLLAAFDCTPEMIDAIRAGKIIGTAAQQPVLMGRYASQSVAKILKGEKVEKEIKLGTLLVTKDNIGQIYNKLIEVAMTEK